MRRLQGVKLFLWFAHSSEVAGIETLQCTLSQISSLADVTVSLCCLSLLAPSQMSVISVAQDARSH